MKNKYRCSSCNWKFSRNYKPNLCPYCGKPSVSEDESNTADDFLKDVE